jgi:Na+-driven multidrug efflux pump
MMRQRREAAIGYAMGARLEYILIPIGFGFGTAISAMVGTNWGAGQYRRARSIGWTGAATVAATFATIGMVVALFPEMWMGLFSNDEQAFGSVPAICKSWGRFTGFMVWGRRCFSSRRELEATSGQ